MCDEKRFVQVAVNLPLNDVFDYSVPLKYQDAVSVGKRVWVPFRNKVIVGYIVNVRGSTDIPRTRDIREVIDTEPLLSEEMLKLTRWIADYYFCSWGEAIEAAVAGPFKKGKTSLRVRKSALTLRESGSELKSADMTLNAHQDKALLRILPYIQEEKFKTFLLHGITASGKTEVYFAAIEAVLQRNKSALVFVPEIALTPQTVQRFTQKFGRDKVSVIHSRLNNSEKFVEWQRIKNGEAKIVVGPRSAIFSPLRDIGLIVVDEEHEHSYKQEDVPRYHLVQAAIKRAEISRAVVILGSATPLLESMYCAEQGEYELIELPERIKGLDLPPVQVVDMSMQRRVGKRPALISKVLEDNIVRCIKNKEQVILFLNRRGFSTFVHCPKCGYVVHCPRCNIALVYHFDRKELVCHHCHYHGTVAQLCPECRSGYIQYFGTGTQKVESELHRLFPGARIARMDSDALQKKTAHFEIFDAFKAHEIDIMIGTQMLAKGLDFPNVTLVGVISADVTLNLPDFRASERTFSLLTQVAGRTGRGAVAGKVIIQTYTPKNYAIQCAITHDYNAFYKQEMVFREQLSLPPYAHMVSIVLRSKEEAAAAAAAEDLAKALHRHNKGPLVSIMDASPLPISKLRGYFRWAVVIKSRDVLKANKLLAAVFAQWRPAAKVKVAVDVDPLMVL
ncbi:MAG: primosomal protein N' [Candidatus Omnitrophica bacterium]|nr:primosomal protein N' [Candidatus Omnitrophota bacterium]